MVASDHTLSSAGSVCDPQTRPHSSRTKVTSMLTWYSVALPSVTLTCCSLIQAALTLRRVWLARLMPVFTASSKLFGEVALISVTRATDMFRLQGGWTPSR